MAKKKSNRNKSRPGQSRSERENLRKSQQFVAAAQEAWNRGLHERAIALYSEALRRDPTNTKLMVDLARAFGLRRNYASAEKYLERAVRAAPRKAAVQNMVARTYGMIARPERAAECYRRALELNPDAPETTTTLVELSDIHERRHQIDAAREALDRALDRDPEHEEARLKRAILDRRSGDATAAESQIRSMLQGAFASWQVHADAWHELASLLDRRGEYREAFDAFTQAKRLLRPHRGPVAKQNAVAISKNRQLLASISRERFERWNELARDDAPKRSAVLTSHPRSGTTLIEQVLDSHDQLISADEFNIFSDWVYLPLMRRFPGKMSIPDVLDELTPELRQQARTIYWERTEAVLEETVGNRILLDKNPALTFLIPVINWVFPEMRLIVPLRDPRDVVLSCFMQNVPLNSVSVNWLSLEEAASHYARMMKTWLTVRPLTRAEWIEVHYEETVDDLEGVARRLLEFLELPWDERVLSYRDRAASKLVRSPTYEDVTKPVYRGAIGRWENYSEFFADSLAILEPYIKEFGYS